MNLHNSQDSDGPERLASVGPKTKKALFYKGRYIQASFLLLAALALVFPPMTSQASLLSKIVGEKADAASVSVPKSTPNSQTITLLEASPRIDPMAADAAEVTIYDDSALTSEVGPLGTVADVALVPATDEISLYVVKKGDTVSTIAELFNVSTGTIRSTNDLVVGQSLKEGMVLTILPVSGVDHTIGKNDTLKKIAVRYNADVSDIEFFNGITEDTVLEIGSTIIVPNGELPAPVVVKKVVKSATSGKPLIAKTVSSEAPSYDGYYIRPISGGRKSQGAHKNNRSAIDLAAPTGTPIVASASGTIFISDAEGYNGGYGKYVVMKHDNGTQTLYAHMSRVTAISGTQVSQGDIIGYVGSTGHSTGPHVHFEVRGAKNPGITPGVWER